MSIVRSGNGIKEDEVIANREQILLLAKDNRLYRGLLGKLPSLEGVQIIWSMWIGYWEKSHDISDLCAKNNLTIHKIHTSGHATIQDLKSLTQAIQPKMLVPIHTFFPDQYDQFGVPVRMLKDGEMLRL